jgi:single-stranded-DNA-specific exonuclease
LTGPGVLPQRLVVAAPPDPALAGRLAGELTIPYALACLLVQRGFTDPASAKDFLRPQLASLADPYRLHGMARSVELIRDAVRSGAGILVHGDYDVDGQTATAILTRVLREAGARVTPFVPHRLRDGYDFSEAGIREAERVGAAMVITCDCGTTAVDALVPELGLPDHLPLHLLDLVALATVADVVPLTGENRVLVRHGLRLLQHSRWPGVQALISASGLAGRSIRAGQVGFILAPRLNAAGRVGEAMDGLRLLLSDDPAEAAQLAERLERRNEERQALDQRILDEVLERIAADFNPERDSAFVLGGDDWHPGVVGIVASRVVERYGRPTFLVGFDGDVGKGSGRSISRFNLHEALVACGDHLDRYGGHHMAAGLTVHRSRFDQFREEFTSYARRELEPATLGPEQRVDLEIRLDEATDDLERLCRHLEPCGMGNPAPVFGLRGVRFDDPRIVGRGHLKGELRSASGGAGGVDAIGFDFADRLPGLSGGTVDAAVRLERNVFRGTSSLQARLLALAPADQ